MLAGLLAVTNQELYLAARHKTVTTTRPHPRNSDAVAFPILMTSYEETRVCLSFSNDLERRSAMFASYRAALLEFSTGALNELMQGRQTRHGPNCARLRVRVVPVRR